MGKKVDKPPTPDYAGAAQAQRAANLQAGQQGAISSNPIMSTPYGGQNVDYMEDGRPVITQTLNPAAQATLEQQQGAGLGMATTANDLAQQVRTHLSSQMPQMAQPVTQLGGQQSPVQQGLDTSGVAQMPVNAGTTAQQALMARLLPAQQQARTSTETQLVNQGLRPGGEAYDNAVRLLGQQENDQRSQAALQGIGLDMQANQQGFGQAFDRGQFANNAQGQQFGQNLQSAQFANQGQGQQFSQGLQSRNQPLNELNALLSGSQIQNPQFSPFQGTSFAPAPTFQGVQAQGQWDQNQYNQEVAQRNAMMGGLFSLGGLIPGVGGLFGLGGQR